MTAPEQNQQHELFTVLAQQKAHQQRVDRVLFIVLPIIAFLLSVICANYNWQSTLGTFVILLLAFYVVGIRRWSLWMCLCIITVYSLMDTYLSYQGQLPVAAVGRHLGTMLAFTGILGLSRPYIDRWLMK